MNESDQVLKILLDFYGITPEILDRSSWGYNTATYYTKRGSDVYAVKVTPFTPQKQSSCLRDVEMSGFLSAVISTPTYLPNINGSKLTSTTSLIVRVAGYVEGTAPFKMDLDIYSQLLDWQRKIHQKDPENLNLTVVDNGTCLLHGDPTPSNIIVSDSRIVCMMDFEDSVIGPVEYDISKSAVFSWYRMPEVPFKDVWEFTLNKCRENVSVEKFGHYCLEHASNHLKRIVTNREKYTNQDFWQDDYNFSFSAHKDIKGTVEGYNIDS